MLEQGVDEWKAALAREESDAAHLAKEVDRDAGKVEPWAMYYWIAFGTLCSDRQTVSEMLPVVTGPSSPPIFVSQLRELKIPFTAVNAYASRYRIKGDRFDQFVRIMSTLDIEYLNITAELRDRSARSVSEDADGR